MKIAEELKHDWIKMDGTKHLRAKGTFECSFCLQWTANLPRYKDDICPKKNRRKGGERRGRK